MTYIDDPKTQQANVAFIRTSMNKPLLEREEEFKLAKDWADNKNEASLHKLTQAYMRLVVSISTKFKNYGLPIGDLIQEGSIGLMEAASRFEPDRGFRFSTYATWWIRASIQDYVLRNWSIVRTGTTAAQKSLFFNLRRLRAQIKGQSAREYLDADGVKEIAKELGVKEKEVLAMEGRLMSSDQSLNKTITNDTENEWLDLLESEDMTPEDIVIGVRDKSTRSKWLSESLDKLPEREQTIIKKRRLSDDVVTLDTLGKDLGISKERVRQLEQRALGKIKDDMLVKIQESDIDVNTLYLE